MHPKCVIVFDLVLLKTGIKLVLLGSETCYLYIIQVTVLHSISLYLLLHCIIVLITVGKELLSIDHYAVSVNYL